MTGGMGIGADYDCARPEWGDIPVVVITAKELTPDDRARLNGSVEKVLLKGAFSRQDLLNKVRELVSACVAEAGP